MVFLSASILKQPYALVVSNLFIETRDNNKALGQKPCDTFSALYWDEKSIGLYLSESQIV